VSDAALLDVLSNLHHDARDLIRRLDEVIGELPRPTESESMARIAKETFKNGARWIDALRDRVARGKY